MANKLTQMKCKACEGLRDRLSNEQITNSLKQVKGWDLFNNHHIEKNYKFKNFKSALLFVNKIGALAEKEGHHPEIFFGWGYAEIKLYTHMVHGLSINDFIMAAKINKIKV